MANFPEDHMPLNQAGAFHGVEEEVQCAIKKRKMARKTTVSQFLNNSKQWCIWWGHVFKPVHTVIKIFRCSSVPAHIPSFTKYLLTAFLMPGLFLCIKENGEHMAWEWKERKRCEYSLWTSSTIQQMSSIYWALLLSSIKWVILLIMQIVWELWANIHTAPNTGCRYTVGTLWQVYIEEIVKEGLYPTSPSYCTSC